LNLRGCSALFLFAVIGLSRLRAAEAPTRLAQQHDRGRRLKPLPVAAGRFLT
jgi:hypothetical protein